MPQAVLSNRQSSQLAPFCHMTIRVKIAFGHTPHFDMRTGATEMCETLVKKISEILAFQSFNTWSHQA